MPTKPLPTISAVITVVAPSPDEEQMPDVRVYVTEFFAQADLEAWLDTVYFWNASSTKGGVRQMVEEE
jgi:hypothetical protein